MSYSTFGTNLKFLAVIVFVQLGKEWNHKMLRNHVDLADFENRNPRCKSTNMSAASQKNSDRYLLNSDLYVTNGQKFWKLYVHDDKIGMITFQILIKFIKNPDIYKLEIWIKLY